jgi:hypothetical protein
VALFAAGQRVEEPVAGDKLKMQRGFPPRHEPPTSVGGLCFLALFQVSETRCVCYVLSMSIRQTVGANASSIRRYIRTHYFEPARKRHETLVTLRAGDIHRELGLRNRVPNVCQVMESKLLEKEAGVKVSSKQGPPSGRGTTLTVTYTVDLHAAGNVPAQREDVSGRARSISEHPGVALFYELRGQGRDIFAREGGGEAWLDRERASFYGPDKKDLE